MARDLHDNEWKFRHIFRGEFCEVNVLKTASTPRLLAVFMSNYIFDAGQPKRHLLTTGWSVFVSAKRLVAGDSVIFIWFVFMPFLVCRLFFEIKLYHSCN